MRILFFCTDPLRYDPRSKQYLIGGGWVTAVIQGLRQRCPEWVFGIGCEGEGAWGESAAGCVRYPLAAFYKKVNKLKRKLCPAAEAEILLPEMLKCVADFHPDVIFVFGSESPYGVIAKYTKIPVLLHIQGFLTAYQNALLPPGVSRSTLYQDAFPNFKRMLYLRNYFHVFDARTEREKEILKNCMHYFGRTEWDRAVLRQYNPAADYVECWELLRDAFYKNAGAWRPHPDKTIRIVSTISTPIYKGADLILKTANLLKERGVDFQWEVIGISGASLQEKLCGIQANAVNVRFCGSIKEVDVLVEKLLASDVYVHPSYIENSPNSLCEAQMLGIPVIAVAAGGVPSLVEHRQTGMLVPANDPYVLAEYVTRLKSDMALAQKISGSESVQACKRHAKEDILGVIIQKLQEICADHRGPAQ